MPEVSQPVARGPGRTDGRRVDRLTHQEQWARAAEALDCECWPRQADRCHAATLAGTLAEVGAEKVAAPACACPCHAAVPS